LSARGLVLPAGLAQPFALRALHDDLHAMVYFDGHDAYEAVETMVRRGAAPLVRVIATRHDQSQIDHVNDADALEAARASGRETCLREIAVEESRGERGPRVRVALESHRGEPLVLEVAAASEPDARWGGVTDPGGHSPHTSLTVMVRQRSALSGPGSSAAIAGKTFPARRGHFTEGHTMGVLRAGTRVETGLGWRSAPADGGALRLERGEEAVTAFPEGERLRVTEIGVGAWLRIRFEPGDAFALDVGANPNALSGKYAVRESADIWQLALAPEQPAWAAARELEVHCAGDRGRLTLTTRVSLRAQENP
jgi:hypothetical protein